MSDISPILLDACVIVDGIAFEAVNIDNQKKLLATDLTHPTYKASFVVRGNEVILSVSSFQEHDREKALLEAVHINNALLLDEVANA